MPAPPRTRQPSCQSARGLAQSKTLAHFPVLSCRRSALAAHKTEEPGGAGGCGKRTVCWSPLDGPRDYCFMR